MTKLFEPAKKEVTTENVEKIKHFTRGEREEEQNLIGRRETGK
jgi:hypothetical protein